MVLSFVAIIDKFHISDELAGVVAVNRHHTFKFFVRKVEVDSGKYLTELLGSHFLMVVTIPILEKGLEVQAGGDTKVSEAGQELLHMLSLLLSLVLKAIMVIQIVRNGLVCGHGFFKSLDLENLFHVIAEGSPVKKIAIDLVSFHQ